MVNAATTPVLRRTMLTETGDACAGCFGNAPSVERKQLRDSDLGAKKPT